MGKGRKARGGGGARGSEEGEQCPWSDRAPLFGNASDNTEDFLWFMSSEFFRTLPQLLPRHCRQVVRLVIRHLAFPQDEECLHPLCAQRPEGLTILLALRPLLVVIRPGPLARAQREEGHLIDYGPQGLVAGEAEVDDLLLAALHGDGYGASVRLQMVKRLPPPGRVPQASPERGRGDPMLTDRERP